MFSAVGGQSGLRSLTLQVWAGSLPCINQQCSKKSMVEEQSITLQQVDKLSKGLVFLS